MRLHLINASVSLIALGTAGIAHGQQAIPPAAAPANTDAAVTSVPPGSNDATAAPSADAAEGAPAGSAAGFLDEIVVTGQRQGKSLIRSSNSVTSLTSTQINEFVPRTEADVLHLIPGIRVESTAGEGGNSNITVRGLPLASGGSKYIQLQEDGIPDVEFGDIAFGNNDYWLRYDYTVDSVQAVRGGNASTGASQAPGAIINYISKTGKEDGGKIGVTTGLDYLETRVDGDYGGHLTDTLRYNIGGYFRTGDGPRPLPYHGLEGYQIKANITKELDADGGYIRLNVKRLDDRAPSYTSAPFGVNVSGNTITGYYPLPGFDARRQTAFSQYNLTYPYLRPDGSVATGNNREGIHSISTSIGGELHKNFGNFTVDDRIAYTFNNGTFAVPFYGSLTTAGALTGANPYTVTVGGTTYTAATARYANGPLAGQLVPGATVLNGNPTLNTTMNNMNHFGNDLGLTGKFDFLRGKIVARIAYYHYNQTIDMDWHWNGSFTTAGASNNTVRVNLYNAAGTALTDNGLTGYDNQWGGFNRHYGLEYSGDAPYATLNYEDDHIDLDGSVRYDNLHGGGVFLNTAANPTPVDVNRDGVLTVAEQNSYLNSGVAQPLDYDVHYTSWSVGANYKFNRNTAVFGRASQGYRANADRLLGTPGIFTSTGQLTTLGYSQAVNPVTQQEIGIKQRGNVYDTSYGLFLTAFRSQATEYNFDLTRPLAQQITFQLYHTWGIELETQFAHGPFSLNGNVTYLHSRIAKDLIGNNTGNVPLATPDLAWTITPAVNFDFASLGFTIIGQTNTFPQNDNVLKQTGVTTVNAFVTARPLKRYPKASITVNAANIFNTFDQAGRLDQGSVGDLAGTGALYGVPYAATNRVAFGRTVSLSLGYEF